MHVQPRVLGVITGMSLFYALSAFSASGGLAEKFVATIQIPDPSHDVTDALLYGNDQYGYYETRAISHVGGATSATLMPPGFRFPVELYLRKKGADGKPYLVKTESRKFRSPFIDNFGAISTVDAARLTPRFFLGKKGAAAYIANRFGEIVWAYTLSTWGLINIATPLGMGKYAFLGDFGIFETARFDGVVDVLMEPYSDFPNRRTPMHHDLVYGGGPDFYTFGYRALDYAGDPYSALKPDRYLVGNILKVTLKTGQVSPVWDAFNDGPKLYGDGWTEDPEDVGTFGTSWFTKPAHRDFEHVNSLNPIPGKGFLVSLRNFSTLVFLDEAFRFRWSLGPTPGATISTKGKPFEFFRQHHATVLPNGNILLFDNGRTESRLLEIRVDEKAHSAELIGEFRPDKPVFAKFWGSAHRLPNGHTLGAFVYLDKPYCGQMVVEFDRSGKEIGAMKLFDREKDVGYRITPIDTIGEERYLGQTIGG